MKKLILLSILVFISSSIINITYGSNIEYKLKDYSRYIKHNNKYEFVMFRKYLDSVQTKREKYFRITEFVDFLLTYSHINIKDSVYESEKNMWEYFYKVAITQRKGVCQDYTNVFAHLCEQNNLECQVVSGFGKGVTTSIKRNVNI